MMRFAVALLAFFTWCTLGEAWALESRKSSGDRQARLAEQLARIDEIVRWHGEYRVIRDTMYNGPHGLVHMGEAWTTAAQAWVKQGFNLVGNLRVLQGQLSDSVAQTQVRNEAAQLRRDWSALVRAAALMRVRGFALQGRLHCLGPLNVGQVGGYEDATRFANERYTELVEATKGTLSAFGEHKIAVWESAIATTIEVIVAALQKASVAVPALRAELEYTVQAIEAELELAPIVGDVEASYEEFRSMMLEYRVFRAEEALNSLRYRCLLATAHLARTGIDPEFSSGPANDIRRIQKAAETMFERQVGLLGTKGNIAKNLRVSMPSLLKDCQDAERRRYRNCSVAKKLQGIDVRHIEIMTDAELKFVELSLERAKGGPLS